MSRKTKDVCITAMIISLIIIFILLISNIYSANAGDWLDNWEFNIMGISDKDFDGRHPVKIIVGGLASLAAHEVLGHLLASEMTGMGTGRMCLENAFLIAKSGDGYYDASDDQRGWFFASGMVVQALGSVVLTAIPETRHSDYTLGWNVVTTGIGFKYAVLDIGKEDTSDVLNMEENGWPGTEIAWGASIIGGITTYYSLNKNKD